MAIYSNTLGMAVDQYETAEDVNQCVQFQEVVQFLNEFKAVEIFVGIIGKSKAPRVTVSVKS